MNGELEKPELLRLKTFVALLDAAGLSADEALAEIRGREGDGRSPLLAELRRGLISLRENADELILLLEEDKDGSPTERSKRVSIDEFVRSFHKALADEGLTCDDPDAIAKRLEIPPFRIVDFCNGRSLPTHDEATQIFQEFVLQREDGTDYTYSEFIKLIVSQEETHPAEEDGHELGESCTNHT